VNLVEGGNEGTTKGAFAGVQTGLVNLIEGGNEGAIDPIQHQRNVNQQIKSTNINNKVNVLYMPNILYDNSYRLIFTLNFTGKRCAIVYKKSFWSSSSSSTTTDQTNK